MGAKVTINSATLMNKGLELIEAHHLFSLAPDKLDVLVHPQSIVHCLVYLSDGSVMAQMSCPDMRTPIAYSLAWPERMHVPNGRVDLAALGALTFEAPDATRFPALRLAREVLEAGEAPAPCSMPLTRSRSRHSSPNASASWPLPPWSRRRLRPAPISIALQPTHRRGRARGRLKRPAPGPARC